MNWERVRTARQRGRALLLLGGMLFVVPVLLGWFVPAEPMFGYVRPPWWDLPKAIGFFGMLFGLAWMWRIYKAPTKYEGACWRYRDHD